MSFEVALLLGLVGAELTLELRILVALVTQVCEQGLLFLVGPLTERTDESLTSVFVLDDTDLTSFQVIFWK